MLKPVQLSLRAQLSEQSSSEDGDIVSFAVSNAHLIGPFSVVLDVLNDAITRPETFTAVTEITVASSSNGREIAINFSFIFC